MAKSPKTFSLRSFRDGDEEALARIFNSYASRFFGPEAVTASAWRQQFRKQDWSAPSVEADRDCVRIAEREGELIGYAVTDYQPLWMTNTALIQELCLAQQTLGEEAAVQVMQALIEDAEHRARERGKAIVLVHTTAEDGLVAAAAAARGFEPPRDSDSVFMAAITNLAGFLEEIACELGGRLAASEFCDWRGKIHITSGEQAVSLEISNGCVSVGTTAQNLPAEPAPDISATITQEALPLLLLGRSSVPELYLQDALSVEASDRQHALWLLDALFPRLPLWLPRAQWW